MPSVAWPGPVARQLSQRCAYKVAQIGLALASASGGVSRVANDAIYFHTNRGEPQPAKVPDVAWHVAFQTLKKEVQAAKMPNVAWKGSGA